MEWKIEKSKKICQKCGVKFAPEEEYFSGIVEKKGIFERLDYCKKCWEEQDKNRFFSYWHTINHKKKKRQEIDENVLLEFVKNACGTTEEINQRKEEFLYIVTLLLMRKKRFIFSNYLVEGENRFLLVKDKVDNELFKIKEVKLGEEDIQKIQQEISVLMNI